MDISEKEKQEIEEYISKHPAVWNCFKRKRPLEPSIQLEYVRDIDWLYKLAGLKSPEELANFPDIVEVRTRITLRLDEIREARNWKDAWIKNRIGRVNQLWRYNGRKIEKRTEYLIYQRDPRARAIGERIMRQKRWNLGEA